jgi:O-antigen ligase
MSRHAPSAATPDSPLTVLGDWLRHHRSALLLLSVLALLPLGRSSELPMLVAALIGSWWAWRGRVDWRADATRLAMVLFLAYWLPQLLSAIDAVAPRKAWTEVVADLRYLAFLWFALVAQQQATARRFLRQGAALVLLVWVVDALLQAATGWSLGGPLVADRLSGIFGADLKLGGVVAVLSPLLLVAALERGRGWALLAFCAVLAVVLLAGARAAWLMLGLVVLLLLLTRLPRKQLWPALLVAAALAVLGLSVATSLSERFAERIERSSALLAGDAAAIDHAVSFRLPIWQAAWSMFRAHPVNGVGVRGFRHAYADHAAADDRWLGFDDDLGAFHAHQIVLELLSETGLIGLACWLLGAGFALRAWWRSSPAARAAALPIGIALAVMLFPLNTHYAFYSSVWGGLLFWLLALWLPALRPSLSTPAAAPAGGA